MHYAKVRKSSLGDLALAARTLDQSPFALSCIAACQLLNIRRRQLRAVDLDRQLVEFGGQRKWRFIVLVVDAGQCVREVRRRSSRPIAVRHRQCLRHPLCRYLLAVNPQRAGARLGKAAEVVVFERANSDPFVLEVKLDRMPSRWQRVRAFPFDAFEVDHIPKEHRLPHRKMSANDPKRTSGRDAAH